MGYSPRGHKESEVTESALSYLGFLDSSVVENPPAGAGDVGLIPGSGRSPGGRYGNPLQCSCLGNPVGYSPWGHEESLH